jgi:hypothetical protein
MKHRALRAADSRQGSALTTDHACPLCDEDWALRHPSLGNYNAVHVAQEYFNGGVFGPTVSPYHAMDHTIWLLSKKSRWLPEGIHAYLLDGMKNWITWHWGPFSSGSDPGGEWPSNGALLKQMRSSLDKNRAFKWTKISRDDAHHRVSRSVETLSLPEAPEELFDLFCRSGFPESYIQTQKSFPR